MIFTVLGFLTGSKIGRWVAIAGIVLVGAAYIIWAAKRSGANAEKAKQVAASLNNLRSRISTNDEIRALSPDARRDELRKWASG